MTLHPASRPRRRRPRVVDWLRRVAAAVGGRTDGRPRWVFVTAPVHGLTGPSDWILTGICREIERHGGMRARFATRGGRLGDADCYFFAHPSRLVQFLEARRGRGRRVVFFTHFEPDEKRSLDGLISALRQADRVIAMSSTWRDWLIAHGLDAAKVRFVLCGADPDHFEPHQRGSGALGFVSWFKRSKNADKLLAVARRMPDARVILLGRNWQAYERFGDLVALPNFEYVETDYARYPDVYRRMDVFASVSRVEGGPIPLLESMMCNVVPVVSRTGFAADVVRHGENGFLFDVDADPETIVGLIRQAFVFPGDVRSTVKHATWRRFVQELLEFVEH